MPFLTVGIPAYNVERQIAAAILSVTAQTWQGDLEILVVNDGSTDGTNETLERLKGAEPRVRVVNHEKNLGRPAARSTLLREARGEWFAFLDADDLWAADKLDRQFALLDTMGVSSRSSAMICGNLLHVNEDTGERRVKPFARSYGRSYSLRDVLLSRNTPYSQMGLAQTDFLRRVGDFDGRLTRAQDWDFLIRFFAQGGRVYFVDGPPLARFNFRRAGRRYQEIQRCMDLVVAKHRDLYRVHDVSMRAVRSQIRKGYIHTFIDRRQRPLAYMLAKNGVVFL